MNFRKTGNTQSYLSDTEVHALLNKDLPYIINSMLAHDLMMYRKDKGTHPNQSNVCYSDSLVVDPAFELGPLFARKLLNFLGLTIDKSQTTIKRKTHFEDDDVRITCLGPNLNFCDLDHHLLKENEVSIVTLLKLANKSIAHLTSISTLESDFSHLKPAKLAIYHLMLEYVEGLNTKAIWWTEQGPS